MPDLVTLGHMNEARWVGIAETYATLGLAREPLDLEGFLFTGVENPDMTWVYRLTGLIAAGLLLGGAVIMHFMRLNRRLVREMSRRETVEQALREKQAELYELANTDPLTGAGNRLSFNLQATREVSRSQRYGQPMSLIFLDLDHFKAVNDEFGHFAGDEILVSVTELLNRRLRQSDSLYRWGGEEFVVLAPQTDQSSVVQLAEDLRQTIAESEMDEHHRVTASLGVATLQPDEDLESLVKRADQKLYEAKAQGRDRVVV